MIRRHFLAVAIASAVLAASPALASDASIITPQEAHSGAQSGELLLIDIRTEGEWRDSGVGEGAHAISMRDRKFLSKVEALTGGDKDAKVALICAQGVRSAWLRNRMEEEGYSNVIDVSRGMMGNDRGDGWIAQGLPINAYAQ